MYYYVLYKVFIYAYVFLYPRVLFSVYTHKYIPTCQLHYTAILWYILRSYIYKYILGISDTYTYHIHILYTCISLYTHSNKQYVYLMPLFMIFFTIHCVCTELKSFDFFSPSVFYRSLDFPNLIDQQVYVINS